MRVLFVCLGNICRSPTVHGVFRELAQREAPGLVSEVDSAGTADYHVGRPPDPRSCHAAAQRGYDLSDLRARQVEAIDFERFDLLLAMDRANLQALRELAPRSRRGQAQLFLEYAGHEGLREVPDPYYGGADGFAKVYEMLVASCAGLLDGLA